MGGSGARVRHQGLGTLLTRRLVEALAHMGKALAVADVASANRPFLDLVGQLGFREGMTVTFCWKDLR